MPRGRKRRTRILNLNSTNSMSCIDCKRSCTAACCKVALMPLHNVDHARWAKYHGFKIFRVKETGEYRAEFPVPCAKLTKEGKCSVYGTSDRPILCDDYWCGEVTYEEVTAVV